MGENECKDNEKVLYKTTAKVSLPHKNPQEANLLVTEGHVVIEVEEPIKIPLSRIKDCRATTDHSSIMSTSSYG